MENKNPTVKELDDLVEAISKQRAKIEEMEKLVSVENVKLAGLEQKAGSYLDELERDSYKSPHGTISMREEWRFSLPQTDEDKQAFFEHLRSKGLFDKLATIHSQSYNSYIKAEWAIAKDEGWGMEFKLPGVPEPKFFRKVSLRKA